LIAEINVFESEMKKLAEVKRIRCGGVNSYLIEEQGRAVLVNTGRIGFEEKVLAQCRKTKVELIVLTHGHADHVQNEKDVIVGDALMNMFYPGLSLVYWDRAEMLKSADKISALGARKVYFGHGSPVENRAWNKTGI